MKANKIALIIIYSDLLSDSAHSNNVVIVRDVTATYNNFSSSSISIHIKISNEYLNHLIDFPTHDSGNTIDLVNTPCIP